MMWQSEGENRWVGIVCEGSVRGPCDALVAVRSLFGGCWHPRILAEIWKEGKNSKGCRKRMHGYTNEQTNASMRIVVNGVVVVTLPLFRHVQNPPATSLTERGGALVKARGLRGVGGGEQRALELLAGRQAVHAHCGPAGGNEQLPVGVDGDVLQRLVLEGGEAEHWRASVREGAHEAVAAGSAEQHVIAHLSVG
eukprot:355034-Chlamydomonas_euryale.AAC.7